MRENTVSQASTGGPQPYRVGFLLINNFTLVALASAIEPLRMANQLAGSELYTWQLLSRDGEIVKASDGISISPDGSIADNKVFDIVIVVGGVDITRSYTSKKSVGCNPRPTEKCCWAQSVPVPTYWRAAGCLMATTVASTGNVWPPCRSVFRE